MDGRAACCESALLQRVGSIGSTSVSAVHKPNKEGSPIRALVTGAAGFIGSQLCDRLLASGHEVVGVDCFRDYYPRSLKELNLDGACETSRFRLVEVDLARDELNSALEGVEVVFHLASRSGLGTVSEDQFGEYVRDNILSTQRLLEALRDRSLLRFVYASSSSVYGEAEGLPTKETSIPRPLSTYGITKLAAEHLVRQHGRDFGTPTVVLRYFTVYGPRQRPDMAISRFMHALVGGEEIEIRGDGEQTRDFTYVDDVIEATIRAAEAEVVGEVVNIGGGSRTSINSVLSTLEDISGRCVRVRHLNAAVADQRHAVASINVARQRLGWEPRVSLGAGLANQWSWFLRLAGNREADHEFAPAFSAPAYM